MKISFGAAGVTGHVARPVKNPPRSAFPAPQGQKEPLQTPYNRVALRSGGGGK